MQNAHIHNIYTTDKAINPGLYIVATPIGNLEDITFRACTILNHADLIVCEDTRITQRLLQKYNIKTPLSSYHDHNGAKVRPKILKKLQQNKTIALICDGGTPLISDPGYKLVRDAGDLSIPIYPIPGPCAAITALSGAGISNQHFFFGGFLPHKPIAKRTILKKYRDYNTTLIFYEAPTRILNTLQDCIKIFGNREAVIAREITKLYEEIRRAPLQILYENLNEKTSIRGEITLLIAPPKKQEITDNHDGNSKNPMMS